MKLASFGKKVATAATLTMASAAAFATDHTATLQAAVDEGQANYTLVVVGVITLAATSFGIGLIVRAMSK